MSDGICDIDKVQSAIHVARVKAGERVTTLALCEEHYQQLRHPTDNELTKEILRDIVNVGYTIDVTYDSKKDITITVIEK